MTIELKPEHEVLLKEALRQGRFESVEEALSKALDSILGGTLTAATPSERAAAFRDWAANHPHTTPVLTDEAISRESMYSVRG
jgi:hypothetical protein